MSTWRMAVSAVCLGVACALLQPHQPQSAIATLLLCAVLVLVGTA